MTIKYNEDTGEIDLAASSGCDFTGRSDSTQALKDFQAELYATAGGVKGGGLTGAAIRFKAGTLVLGGGSNWNQFGSMRLRGASMWGGPCGTRIIGGDDTHPLFEHIGGTPHVEISEFNMQNQSGDAVSLAGGFGGFIKNCLYGGKRGLNLQRLPNPPPNGPPFPNTGFNLVNQFFDHCSGTGMTCWGRMACSNLQAVQCATGFDICGSVSITYMRTEECAVGATWGSTAECQGLVANWTSEACLKHGTIAKNAKGLKFLGHTAVGDKYQGTQSPSCIWEINGGEDITFENENLSGTFTQATILIGRWVKHLTWINTHLISGLPKAWIIDPNYDQTQMVTINGPTIASLSKTLKDEEVDCDDDRLGKRKEKIGAIIKELVEKNGNLVAA